MKPSGVAWIFRQAFRASPVILVWTTVAAILLAFVPAIQVLLIESVISSLGSKSDGVTLGVLLMSLGLLAGLTPSLTALVDNFQKRASQKLQSRLNVLVVREASRIQPSVLANSGISTQVERHSRAIGEGVAWSVRNFISASTNLLSAVGVIAAVFSFSWVAGLCTILALLPPLIHSRKMSAVWEREWEMVSGHYDKERYLRDLVVRQRTATELTSLGSSERVAELVAREWENIQRIMGKALYPQTLGSLASAVATAALLVGAIFSVVTSEGYAASAAAGIYGVLSAVSSAGGAGLSAGLALELVPQITRLRDFIGQGRASRSRPVANSAERLNVCGVSYQYKPGAQYALRDASLTAKKGEVIAIVGSNGAGKTTLVNAITGLIDSREGEIVVDSTRRGDLPEADWLSHFGLLTQEFGRFELTVREAVKLGDSRRKVSDEQIWDALRRAHADAFVEKLPDGLDQQLGEQFGGVGISGGQWQRLALARIYLRNAPIWILDEPTSAIDAEAEEQVFNELVASKDERITIVVSHRAWTLRGTDRIYVMDEGAIVEHGTYDQLMDLEGRFAKLFESQR